MIVSKDQTGGQKPSILRILQNSSRLSWNESYGHTEEDLQFHLVWFRWVLILFAYIQEDTVDKGTEPRKASVSEKSDWN